MDNYDSPDDDLRQIRQLVEDPPGAVDWNLLDSKTARQEWHDLDQWVTWLKVTFGLPPSIVPPSWHRHDELVWELSALHTHWLGCYDESASPSAPIAWMRDFADARYRLRDWVAQSGTRLDRDRPTRQTWWPGEASEASEGETPITDRAADFKEFVEADVEQRRLREDDRCTGTGPQRLPRSPS